MNLDLKQLIRLENNEKLCIKFIECYDSFIVELLHWSQ